MNIINVKICGIRHMESAKAAVTAGADFLGFNFVLSSKRYVNPIHAREIIHAVKKKIKIVGDFQNSHHDEINELIKFLKLDYVQLHGSEDKEFVEKIKTKVIKRITNHESRLMEKVENITHLLLDRDIQGSGDMVDLQKAAEITKIYPTFIAGGLESENVTDVIKQVKPFGVDVAGGIETGGVEDLEKIEKFVRKVKEV